HRDQWAIAVRGLLPGGHGHRRRRPGLRRRRLPPPLSPRGKNPELCLLGTRKNRRGGLLPARDQDRLYLERGLFRCPAGPDLLRVDQEDYLTLGVLTTQSGNLVGRICITSPTPGRGRARMSGWWRLLSTAWPPGATGWSKTVRRF